MRSRDRSPAMKGPRRKASSGVKRGARAGGVDAGSDDDFLSWGSGADAVNVSVTDGLGAVTGNGAARCDDGFGYRIHRAHSW